MFVHLPLTTSRALLAEAIYFEGEDTSVVSRNLIEVKQGHATIGRDVLILSLNGRTDGRTELALKNFYSLVTSTAKQGRDREVEDQVKERIDSRGRG